jgi:hypothetical protein
VPVYLADDTFDLYWKQEKTNKSSDRGLKGSHLEDLGINRKIILEWILKNFGFDGGLDSCGSDRVQWLTVVDPVTKLSVV